MRITPLLAAATAVAALFALTACGGDDAAAPADGDIAMIGGVTGGAGAGAGGGGAKAPKKGTGFKGLPKAGSMAGAARIINGFTPCGQVSTTRSGYGGNPSSDPDAKYGTSYSVTERGYCGGRRERSAIFMIKDPKAFQAAIKAEIEAEEGGGNPNSGPIIGQDFATGSESADANSALLSPQSGLLMLNCHPDFKPPSGYRKEPALVKGCVLTDYYKD
ncbi:hypothetical protein MTF65_17740 [Streptomyces sp. APSN-46.1]|uniref:hypothetical protein n=1 Tax=Streptomyces sp. APSN-46.1 TaxID=2929049 RepID=UPI001FB35ED6|nr:hypothetical protein [Streptomyces sp. APSN-46.1]MCJ1679148.1 hypothetical protein [Streptomyces sp. APSN-46.1]